MTIVASGEISLGGNATATRSVACELGRSGTAQICMNESTVRTLAGVASGQISMSNFYGKSNAPTTFGQFICGGYYTGTVSNPANYYLLVAPNATGCAFCLWATMPQAGGAFQDEHNGYLNSVNATNAVFPAANFTRTRNINGYTDWYLPAAQEMCRLYTNRNSMPSGEGYVGSIYWSSTVVKDVVYFNGNSYYRYERARGLQFYNGTTGLYVINAQARVRAIRRIPI